MPTLYLALWGIALFGFAFWYAHKKDHGTFPYVSLLIIEAFILYLSYMNEFGNMHQGHESWLGKGLTYFYLLLMQFIITTAIFTTILIYQAKRRKANLEKQESTILLFFQNVHYWIWHYSLKVKMKHPWRAAQIVAGTLLFSYLIFIVKYLLVISMLIPGLGLIVFFVVFIVDFRLYKRSKYCTKRVDDTLVSDERYCILKERYDAMSAKQILKWKASFFVYFTGALITLGLTFFPYLLWVFLCTAALASELAN